MRQKLACSVLHSYVMPCDFPSSVPVLSYSSPLCCSVYRVNFITLRERFQRQGNQDFLSLTSVFVIPFALSTAVGRFVLRKALFIFEIMPI